MADFKELTRLLTADLYRYTGRSSRAALLRELVLGDTFKYVFWFRVCRNLRGRGAYRFTLYPLARWFWRRYTYRFGIDIPLMTDIGPGLYLPHFGGIVINHDCRLGSNCTLSHGVTIGKTNRGERAGCPAVGDNVFIGPGAVIIGAIRVGNDVAIGANSVVTRDVPDSAVVAGAPARVLSLSGSAGYVSRAC